MVELASVQYRNAIQACMKDRHQCPPSLFVDAHMGLGECYDDLKNYRESISQYRRVLELMPDREQRMWALYRMARGSAKVNDDATTKKTITELKSAGDADFWAKVVDYVIGGTHWSGQNQAYLSRN